MEALRSLQIFILGKEQINLLISTFIVINIIDLVFSLTGKLQTLFLAVPESRYAVLNWFLPCCNIVFFPPTASMFTLNKQAEEAMEDGVAEKEDDFQTDEDEDEDGDENEEMEVDKQVQQKRKKVCRGLK